MKLFMSRENFSSSFYRGRKVVVTGGAGFVGSNLAQDLVAAGARVTIVDNFHADYGANTFNLETISNSIELLKADVTDRALMAKTLRETDVVFHAAAQCSHVDSMVDPWLDLKFNCEGTLSILEACKAVQKDSGKAPRVVYISTRAVIGAPLRSPATETTLPNPVDVYGVNKLASEYYGAVYARVHRIPFVSVRMTNSFGPRHQMRHGKYGILNWFMSLALQGKTIKVFGSGEQLRDYVYISDAVNAMMRAGIYCDDVGHQEPPYTSTAHIAGAQIPFAVFNVASGRPLKFVDCARKVVEMVGTGNLEMVPWPADRKAIETGDFVADCSEAANVLGWKPTVGFDEGMGKTLSFYREHLNRYL